MSAIIIWLGSYFLSPLTSYGIVCIARRVAKSRTKCVHTIYNIAPNTNTVVFAAALLFFCKMTVINALQPNIWMRLESRFPNNLEERMPKDIDSVLQPGKPVIEAGVDLLFRERNGWCPYSQRAWLAWEVKGMKGDTVRIDNMDGRPTWYSGTTPQARIGGREVGDSMDIVKAIDDKTKEGGSLYTGVCSSYIEMFESVFPSNARPSSRAAYLFGFNGMPLSRGAFEDTLAKVDGMIGNTKGGFMVGEEIGAADICYAPFLERYRFQLPLLCPGLDPSDAALFPNLSSWYKSMDERVPSYACRVRGDKESWGKVLRQQGYGNVMGVDTYEEQREDDAWRGEEGGELRIWKTYRRGREWIGESPQEEVARLLVRNRVGVIKDAIKKGGVACEDAEEALIMVVEGLLDGRRVEGEGRRLKEFLEDRVCVPRDMGWLSARKLREL